jgi:acetyl esterase/lipase
MRFAFALAASIAFAFTSVAQAAEPLQTSPLPIEAIAQLPAMQSVVLSPDGKHMAALVSSPKHRWPVVSIWEVDNLSKPPVWVPSERMRPRNVQFLGNQYVIFFVDQPLTYGARKDFTRQAVITDIEGRSFPEPFAAKGTLSDLAKEVERFAINFGVFLDGSLDSPNRYLIVRENLELSTSEILAVDTTTMKAERVARAASSEGFLLADARDGQIMIKQGIRSTGDGWLIYRTIRNRQTGSWEEHPELGYLIKNRSTIEPLGFPEPDPNKLYVSTNRNTNFAQIRVYDIASRTWESEPAFASPDADITNISTMVDPETKKVIGVGSYTIAGPTPREVFVDGPWAAVQRTLEAKFPGMSVAFGDRRLKTGRAIISVSSPSQPPAYFLLDGKDLKPLGKRHPAINPATLGKAKFVTFKARDGLTIPAFVTLPPGYDKARHGAIPLVVHPHGGPWGRDSLVWDQSGWTQFLATRGYAVIQPQFRGSTNWGMDLWKAGDKFWGTKMQDDKDDAAAYMVAEGIADPKRMAIFGYSYGGFAAIAASVRPNSPYQCAISGAGVSDLQRIKTEWGDNRIQRELQGWTVDGMDPLRNVDKANIPILLYHGDRDRQADTLHSRDFYSAMKSAGKDVEYHEIKDMWHQLPWWPEWHRESLGLIENYLAGPKCFGNKITVTAPNK